MTIPKPENGRPGIRDGFGRWVFMAMAVAVAAGSVAYGLSAPGFGGDSVTYLTVAKNILFNHCVSTATAETAACIPHWGGNQFPGYPLAIAVAGWLAGLPIDGDGLSYARAVIVLQSLCLGAAVYRLGWAALQYSGSPRAALLVVAIAGFSPLHFAWSRWMLTETLSTALALWVLAELLLSLHQRRLRLLPLALSLAAAFFVRYDTIAMCAPVAMAAFLLHRPATALTRGALLALLMAMPISAWTVRSLHAGLPAMPQADYGVGHLRGQGYYAWLTTWTRGFYEGTQVAYPFAERKYAQIEIPERVFASSPDPDGLRRLLAELSARDGEPLPRAIDRAFAERAVARRQHVPFDAWVVAPLARAASMWLAPAYGFGFATQLGTEAQHRVARDALRGVLMSHASNPAKPSAKRWSPSTTPWSCWLSCSPWSDRGAPSPAQMRRCCWRSPMSWPRQPLWSCWVRQTRG